MTKTAVEILQDAMALPAPERAELAAELLASLDGEPEEAVDEAWAAELAARAERVRRGDAEGRPWSAVRADLERRER